MKTHHERTMNVIADIKIPNESWRTRPHQKALWRYLMRGGRRAMAVWHRRAGKDEVMLHATAVAMMKRPGNYWHMLPEFQHARRSIWTAVNPHTGKRRIEECFPREMIANIDEGQMFIRFHNGSTWACMGSDRYDAAMGASCAGLVMSEYALSNPSAWAYFKPMLEENGGWAAFITTPRGRNHAFEMYKYAGQQPDWFCELLTALDTHALTQTQLDEALAEMCALYGEDAGRSNFDQEYMCAWTGSLLGAFYAREMAEVRSEGRIIQCEALPDRAVNYAWDLGIGDDTSVWAWQAQGAQLVLLDHVATSGVGLEWWRDEIFRREKERGWRHGTDFVPHDAKIREWGTGRTRVETMASMGLKPQLVPLASVDDGINAARRSLPLCVFHPRCEDGGISALEQYRREWDDDKKCFKASAVHDWTSHPADSFRYLAMSWKPAPLVRPALRKQEGWRIPPPPDVSRRGGMVL
jgi:hypothetical protein